MESGGRLFPPDFGYLQLIYSTLLYINEGLEFEVIETYDPWEDRYFKSYVGTLVNYRRT